MFLKLRTLLFVTLLLAPLAISAQSRNSASGGIFEATLGVEGSAIQPDYNPSTSLYKASSSPQPLVAPGAFVDLRLHRWLQLEAEVHLGQFDKYHGKSGLATGVAENSYLGGLRLPYRSIHGFTPYVKALAGSGFLHSYADGPAFAIAFGGGVDYQLKHSFRLRAVDFEMQHWYYSSTNGSVPSLQPYSIGAGISYTFYCHRNLGNWY